MAVAVAVEDLDRLVRAFAAADKAVKEDLRDAIMESAAPVRAEAQRLAGEKIRNLSEGDPWTRMRIGILGRSIAYVAPVERGVKTRGRNQRRRPNLKTLLLERAMEPALEQNRDAVARRFEGLLAEVAAVWDRQR